MKFRSLLLLACALVTLSACVVAPYRGGGHRYHHGDHDHDRRPPPWRR